MDGAQRRGFNNEIFEAESRRCPFALLWIPCGEIRNVVLLDLKRIGKSKWKRQLAKRGTYSIR
jgi:hypothetical protein